jgi:signal recognition particle subunit SRP54
MFETLSSRLQDVFRSLRGEGRLTPGGVEVVLREIRLGLLEADVNFRVVKALVDRVRDRALDANVLRSLTPDQHVIRIVRDEMRALFGDAPGGLATAGHSPRAVLLLGLQGSGKTTTAAKLGRWLTGQGRHPLLVSTDVRRPGAIEQLAVLGEQAGLRVLDLEGHVDPVDRAARAVREAGHLGFDVVIVDTAGRLHVDDTLMAELVAIDRAVSATDRLYVADAMTGQDAIKSAGEFNHQVGVTGIVLSKMDGDARGGAALSVVSVVGVPIAFLGTGEHLDDLQPFHADRVVSRILGLGDVLTLIEKAEQAISHEEAAALEASIRRQEFTLEDFRNQLRALTRMGPLDQVLGMIPGLGGLTGKPADIDEGQMTRLGAIIDSMTVQERRHAQIINGNRRKRIARGSGTSVQDVNRLLRQFAQMRKMLKAMGAAAGRSRGGRGRRGAMPSLNWINP